MTRARDLSRLGNAGFGVNGPNLGIGTTAATSALTVNGNSYVTGVVTANAFVGDGSGLTGLPITGSQNLNATLLIGNNSAKGFAVGISTFNNAVVVGGGITDLVVNGNARVTGVLTSGTISATTVTATSSFVGNLTGTATTAQNLTGTPNITVGAVTASTLAKSGGTSIQFLKADGSVDNNTYLTSYLETDNLNSVTNRGNTTSNNISVGIVTASSYYGNGVNISGIVTSIIAGTNISISGSTGNVTINSSADSLWNSTSIGINTLSNVGIGTTNPTSKLTVTGDVLVSGVITTSRLNVETGGLSVSGISSFTGPIYEGVTNSFNTSLTPSSGTLTISTLNSSVIVGALTTSVTTWAFTGVNTTNGRATTLSIIIDSNSLYTYGDNSSVNGIGVSNGVRWAGGLAPTATNNEDILSFTIVTDNSGTIRVYGSSALNYS